MCGSNVLLLVGLSLVLLQLLRAARVAVYFRSDDQIQLFRRDSSVLTHIINFIIH